ncbi:MAG: membrane protein of unknown function [Promethearchaeota archaeon]|nr:MAG: membrane protein of unknown function [Candidatus Lokiarchaeota archaeon]
MYKHKKQVIILSVLLLSIFMVSHLWFNNESNVRETNAESVKDAPNDAGQSTFTQQLIKNPNLTSPIEPDWYWEQGDLGENNDLRASTSPEHANIDVLGEERKFNSLYGTINSSTSDGWSKFENGDFSLPDHSYIDEYGIFANHTWEDESDQRASVHFRKNVSLGVDMSDYNITSASLEVIFNASVQDDVDTPNDDYGTNRHFAIGDFVVFYVQISNLDYTTPIYPVAENKTKFLGQDANPRIINHTNTVLVNTNESEIINALNNALKSDPNYSNFTITLGIDIYCEDNYRYSDTDTFNYLRIKSCNLNFTYKRIIDEYTTTSWNQEIEKISGNNLQIKEAFFNFKYKIDGNWPQVAPLSELKFYINNKTYEQETLKLLDAPKSFQEAKAGGFDVTSLLQKDVNITLSIQVFLKDTFELNQTLRISLDDVYLNVTLINTFPDLKTNFELFLNGNNRTSDPSLTVPIGSILNFTFKYLDESKNHISGALTKLSGTGFEEEFSEYSNKNRYSLSINSTEYFNLGSNLLTITAEKNNYQTISEDIRITVRKINTEIKNVDGSNVITTEPQKNTTISITLNDLDFNKSITDAVVTYSWEYGEGTFTDPDGDGIYEAMFTNIPEGTHEITITVFGEEEYQFEEYTIIINADLPAGPNLTFLISILSIGLLGIVGSIGAYQLYFKYPPLVRKIRKLRNKIKKGKEPKPIKVIDQKEIIKRKLTSRKKSLIYSSIEDSSSLKKKNEVNKKALMIGLLFAVLIISSFSWNQPKLVIETSNQLQNENKLEQLKPSRTEIFTQEWLKNTDFSTENEWFNSTGTQGEISTLNTSIENEMGAFKMLGEERRYNGTIGRPNGTYSPDWRIAQNGDFLLPDDVRINDSGCFVYHFLDEDQGTEWEGQVHNFPSVHFKKNISLPVNMNDYNITSAFLNLTYDVQVDENVEAPGDSTDFDDIFDFATIYAEIADLNGDYSFRIAENTTKYLGRDGESSNWTINNNLLKAFNKNELIDAINTALERDSSHSKFTLVLGIDIYCEDNLGSGGGDEDEWEYIIIDECNFTFEYERKIDKFSSVAWNQIGNKISGNDTEILSAYLNFDYMIDREFPSSLSTFSELRILFNGNQFARTIKLPDINTTSEELQPGGLDVTNLILKDENIAFKLELFIANTFGLEKNFTISFDNVSLMITYSKILDNYPTDLQIFLNGVNKTTDPFIEVPIGTIVNLTAKYLDGEGDPLTRAEVSVSGAIKLDLNESQELGQYSYIINTSTLLEVKSNQLTLQATKDDYQTAREDSLVIKVRKLNATVNPRQKQDTYELESGDNLDLDFTISDNDNKENITGALIRYEWEFGEGVITDKNGDGIYNFSLKDIPAGTYKLNVTGVVGEDYDISEYQITIIVSQPTVPNYTFLITILLGAIVGVSTYFVAYQKVLRYPPMVRKIRRLRKKLINDKKIKEMKVNDRNSLIQKSLHDHKSKIEFEEPEGKKLNNVKEKEKSRERKITKKESSKTSNLKSKNNKKVSNKKEEDQIKEEN